MTNLTKIVRPGTVAEIGRSGNPVRAGVYCKIEHKAGRLSITGVVGPLGNGDAIGSCGQIDSSLAESLERGEYQPADGWSPELLREFLAIWNDWHLNDMRPHSPEMKAAGWPALAATPMLGYEFTTTREIGEARRQAEAAALAALKAGETFAPRPEQTFAAALPYSLKIWTRADEAEPAPPSGYERAKHIGGHASGSIKAPERKTLGWLRPSDHPDGLLGRKLDPADSVGYGGQWWHESVPESVLARLQSLPDSDRKPAWV